MRFTRITLCAALFTSILASNVLDLDSATFDDHIGRSAGALVEFFAPWCGHCKNLAPTYEQLADTFAHAKNKVIIAKIDADGAGKEAGSRFGVTGFPTLKWFPAGSLEPEDYPSGRDLDSLTAFVAQKSGVKAKGAPAPSRLLLTNQDFDDVVMDPENDVLVAFTAPWCGHCKNLKPTLEKVAVDFAADSKCIVAEFDADAAENKPIANRYGVSSYPTLKFFPRGSSQKDAVDYMSGRSEEQFLTYLNEKCGTHRVAGGGLDSFAGRIAALDQLASSFYQSVPNRSSLVNEAKAMAASLDTAAKASGEYYLRVMEKVAQSPEWLQKESSRLSSILSKKTMQPSKLDEIQRKLNILSAFVGEKVADAQEGAQEVFEQVSSSATAAASAVSSVAKDEANTAYNAAGYAGEYAAEGAARAADVAAAAAEAVEGVAGSAAGAARGGADKAREAKVEL